MGVMSICLASFNIINYFVQKKTNIAFMKTIFKDKKRLIKFSLHFIKKHLNRKIINANSSIRNNKIKNYIKKYFPKNTS